MQLFKLWSLRHVPDRTKAALHNTHVTTLNQPNEAKIQKTKAYIVSINIEKL